MESDSSSSGRSSLIIPVKWILMGKICSRKGLHKKKAGGMEACPAFVALIRIKFTDR
jgi:hypothetical protein